MMKTISTLLVFLVLILLPVGCARTLEPEDEEEELPVFTLVVETGETNETDEAESPLVYEETEPIPFPDPIPIYRPFEPKPGNVVMVSTTGYSTVIITDTCIWKIPDTFLSRFYPDLSRLTPYEVGQLFEPIRMMDTLENIYRLIEDSHILTTDQTLYYLDFENGEAVRQLDNVTSIYYFPMGVMFWLRYARTEDGSVWRIDAVEPERLSDDAEMTYELRDPRYMEDRIPDHLLEYWFDDVRYIQSRFVLTENDELWQFRHLREADYVPERIMENVKWFGSRWIITTDNELWRLTNVDSNMPYLITNNSVVPYFIMENVESAYDGGFIITRNNELWRYHFREGELSFIMEGIQSVQSVSGFRGVLNMDNTLLLLPDRDSASQGEQEAITVKENVLRTRWFGSSTEFIITIDGSLWLFNFENYYLVQLFQG